MPCRLGWRLALTVSALVAGWAVVALSQGREGTVRGLSARWETSGRGDRLIVTDVDVAFTDGSVERHQHLGGRIGDLELTVSDVPRLKVGQHVKVNRGHVVPLVTDAVIFGRWEGSEPIAFLVNDTSSVRLTPKALLRAMEFAAAVWPAQTGAAISAVYAGFTNGLTLGNNGRSEVFFRVDPDLTYVARTAAWSSSGFLIDADIVFNES